MGILGLVLDGDLTSIRIRGSGMRRSFMARVNDAETPSFKSLGAELCVVDVPCASELARQRGSLKALATRILAHSLCTTLVRAKILDYQVQ